MNTINNIIQRFRKSTSLNEEHEQNRRHHHHFKINHLEIQLDQPEFKNIDKYVSGKLIIKTHDLSIKNQIKIYINFFDEISIQWEEYQMHALYTRLYSTYKCPYKIDIENYFDSNHAQLIDRNDVESGIYVLGENERKNNNNNNNETITSTNSSNQNHHHNHHQLHEFYYPFKFKLPDYIHGTVNLPNASYNYYIEAYITNEDIKHDTADNEYHNGNEHQNDVHVSNGIQNSFKHLFELFKSSNHTYCKREIKIYNQIMKPDELLLQTPLLKQQIYEAQSPSLRIRLLLPKKAYFSNDIIPIEIEIENLQTARMLDNASNVSLASSMTQESVSNQLPHHHLKLHKISFKLYQYCKVYAETPHRRSRLFDYLIKHTSRKNVEKNINENSIKLVEYFQVPDGLYSTTSRTRLKKFCDIYNGSKRVKHEDADDIDGGVEENDDIVETNVDDSTSTRIPDTSNSLRGDNDEFIYAVRVNYKLAIEFWKNFLIEDSEISVPIVIDPEVEA